jgi:trigger factor
MQVSIEATGALERRMQVQVPAARVEKAIEDRLQTMSRTVRLKGFRPGKVPVKVVRQQFGQQVRNEVLGDVMQQSFNEAIGQEKLVPAANPRIEPVDLAQGHDLKYSAVFEVMPSVELKGIDALAISKPVVEVNVADIDAMIENLRKQRPIYMSVEREARDTDRVTVDFLGTLDGVAFDGGKGDNVQIVLGAGRMLPDFETGLKGTRAGETKNIDVNFPANYQAANLAGKTAQFALTIKTVEEQQLPEVNDEFCTHYGVLEGGVTQLRKEVEENMRQELAQTIRTRVKNQLLDALAAANPIEVPGVLVAEQVQSMQLDFARRAGIRDAAQLPPPDQFKDAARQRVMLGLLVNEVIRSANIAVDRNKIQAKVQEMAEQYPDPEQVHRAYRENAQLRGQIESSVLEDQVIDWLLERAKITDQPATFKDVMNFGA